MAGPAVVAVRAAVCRGIAASRLHVLRDFVAQNGAVASSSRPR